MADSGTSSSRACDIPLVGEPGARKGPRHSHVRRLSRSPRTGACGRRSLLVSAILAGGLLVALTVPPLGCSSRSPAPKACPVRVKRTPPAGWAAHRTGTTTTGKSWSLPFESALGTESSCGFPGAPANGRAPLPPAVSFSSPIQEGDSSPDARYRKRENPAAMRIVAVARPGLEPGTPRFSVVRSESSNQPETPAKRGRRVRGPRLRHTRKFASFLPDSGDEWRLVSHWNWRRAARTAPDVAATPEGLIGDAGAVGDELLRIGHGITPPLSWLSTDSLRGVAEAEHRAIPEMVPSGR